MSNPVDDGEAIVTSGDGHYFSLREDTPSRPSTVRLDLPDRSLELHTDRGVFSADRVDPGTKLLLMELPDLPPGAVVDVGCGYGPIAATVAARRPGHPVWAVDVNPRARELCRRNLAAAAAAGTEVHVVAPEEVPVDLRVAAIVSNPPIRVGKSVLHDLLRTWIGRLDDGGEAWLVVQKHLGADSLARWLVGQDLEVERVRSRQGYRILRVTR
ncbi:MAG: class I SAM-dependent methyltransferase [Microthrixaceae bacterium]